MFSEGFSGRHGLALVRITLGALFCASAWDKTMKGWFANPEPMIGSIQQSLEKAEPIYRPFLEGTVLPNALLFSRLIWLGEWVAGVSLLFGFLTRIGAVSAMAMLLNYMLMKGTLLHQYLVGTTYSDRLYFIAALGFLLVGGAAMPWGLDRLIARWSEDVPFVRHLFGHRPYAAMPAVAIGDHAHAVPIPMRRTVPRETDRRAA
jgi:uncharacterized membrane protein YphA (DoxX/SURF4 family)